MSVALKNDAEQARKLVGRLRLRGRRAMLPVRRVRPLLPFVAAGKAVFDTEYELEPTAFCGRAEALGFSAIRKGYDLRGRPWRPCG